MPSPNRFTIPAGVVTAAKRLRDSASRWISHLSATGVVFGVLLWCGSYAPSLLPREWTMQAAVSGLCLIGGYAFGATVGGFMRWLGFTTPWSDKVTWTLWRIFVPLAVAGVTIFAVLGARWQSELRVLFGMDTNHPWNAVWQGLIALSIAVIILNLARLFRRVGGWVADKLDRWFPRRAAILAATIIVAYVSVLIFDGTFVKGSLRVLNDFYATSDKKYPDHVEAPTLAERSGSPQSQVSWDSLGYQGRVFVGTGPSAQDIAQFNSESSVHKSSQALTPIRVYAGLGDDHDLDAAANKVVQELIRTNAFERESLLVATATGTGWLDPAMTDAFEYVNSGDTAIASMQYSFLPSGISFLTDRSTPPNAGKALFEAIYAHWLTLPQDARPKIYVAGLSLGSYGMQDSFSGIQDLTERTSGALFVGTPNFTEMWSWLTERRDAGSSEIQPVIAQGRQVRFSATPDTSKNLWDLGDSWREPRVVYLQHASDAVTWWSPRLLWNSPDWLSEPAGEDRRTETSWVPIITFLQVTFDMFVSADVPAGHGHVYVREYVDAFAALTQVTPWTESDLELLRDLIQDVS